MPPLPVLRERAGVRGEGAAELERRTIQFSKQALTLTLSLREREQDQNAFSSTFTTFVSPLFAFPMNCWKILFVTVMNSSMPASR